jgi:nitrogen PTS system EIIA component
MMELNKLLRVERCRILRSRTKTEVLHELIEIVAEDASVTDVEGLKREIFYREQIMSTGIGRNIGIPHVRFAGVKEPMILIGIRPSGIADYGSIDEEPVTMVFMILVGEDEHKEYLRILSLLVGRLKDDSVRKALLSAEAPEDILAALEGGV